MYTKSYTHKSMVFLGMKWSFWESVRPLGYGETIRKLLSWLNIRLAKASNLAIVQICL
ncbi:hypothetical protein BABINDRAFT_118267 [Babjeviella inositovora NRRL Y-12698]|uniref:Uncharacterized protein n=1 Tax=Babjeviella inositovora NRRL Y-12698 TaxID=984486 RepID=A0A1E3QVF0_9ASCO|nr:uncharacterized protein BABINDRAFT_118267 [Babjeviella inositovora NRRL Y-12698]ODQ80937.1 hypothetical protein BABINDRAFT_118267 [Babjeviella inositovora NRRL Y-12698]